MARDVILVHGNSLSRSIWEPFAQVLRARGLNVHALDLPGHGHGARLPEDARYTLDLFADHVARLAGSMASSVLVGHSLGGHVCARVPAMVSSVKGVVLFGAPLLRNAADMTKAFIPVPALAKAYTPELTPDDARELARAYTWPDHPGIEAISEDILNTDPRVRAHLGMYLAAGQLPNEVAILGSTLVPVCIVHGRMDPFIQEDYLDELAVELSASPVRMLAEAGHTPQLQCPVDLADVVFEFMDRLQNG